ncbi:N-acetylmuramoyl-L-alanine amidase family protein [Heyndrickxia oleronia]|uniref:N-acetylmuramoyl-L-alanine amidase n=1 Tax=Heyndrickxia oleronia TaxID=38875 RepID=A0AAW6SM41_9BACI|nr:N-acetylmuramoyl-L-alanine amidase [Heyndrickxia oleronia]MDH5159804.1 N-acetylmuramoyl-L-alanine amidase [Heyndrickxia oleronia]
MKIAIDAGHGYNTPGKRTPDGSMREWEFNNAVALLVKPLLEAYKNVTVKLTHDTTGKTDVPLKTRTDTANAWGADVLVSIHANAAGNGWSTAHGIETFVYTSIKAGTVTYKLAENVNTAIVKASGLANRGVKQGDLHMVRETHMPAILVECGFMSNKTESALLKSADYRKNVAQAIVDGLAKTYGLTKGATEVANTNDNKPSAWAKEAWTKATKAGVVDGARPQDGLTREEFTVIIDRLGLLK